MERIDNILQNPQQIEASDLPWIEAKMNAFPYVNSYRLFYLIALYKSDIEKYEMELPKISAYFNDPEYVSHYFKTQLIAPPKEAEESPLMTEPITEEVPLVSEKIEIVEESPSSNHDNTLTKETAKEPHENTPVNESLLAENLRKLGLDHLIPQMYPEVTTKELAEEETETSNLEQEHIQESPSEKKNSDEEETISFAIEENTAPDIEDTEGETNQETLEEVPSIGTEEALESTKEKAGSIDTPSLVDSVIFKNKKTFSDWASLYSRNQPTEEEKSKSTLIDEFIEKNPKINFQKSDEENLLIDINSIVENDQTISHLMTETLANLYVEQRKYSKAIEAYEILILKNPEKSVIFADQIEKLKNIK